ncbi:MAG: peptidase S16 [Betaproteobacteria bacterium]|nr:peptidase S16 [Betaproteobacteria bacterium]
MKQDTRLSPQWYEAVPLFPLQTVLFPGGVLGLKVFEARYLDLMGHCLRHGEPFGVVCLNQGSEVQRSGAAAAAESLARLEACATLARLEEVDADQPGILQIRCIGTTRVKLTHPHQEANGLWRAQGVPVAPDEPLPPPQDLQGTVRALVDAIASLREQGLEPFTVPHQLGHAGWVANRWCEILPISLAAKQRLMELEDPVMRLQLVDEFLRTKGVVRGQGREPEQ